MNKEKIVKALKWFFHSYIWVGILLLIIDIVTKNIVVNTLTEGQYVVVIPNFLRFNYTINRKAAMGIGPDNPVVAKILYSIIALIASVFIIFYYKKNQKKLPGYVKSALMLVLAGAIGNLIDRLFYSPEYLHALNGKPGGVVDFFDFFYGYPGLYKIWHFIFNVADIGVVVGVFILIIYFFIVEEIKEKKANPKVKEKNPEDNEKVLSASEKLKLEEQEKNKVDNGI